MDKIHINEKEYYRQKAKRNLQAVIEQEINMRFWDRIKTTLLGGWGDFDQDILIPDFDYAVIKYIIDERNYKLGKFFDPSGEKTAYGSDQRMILSAMAVKDNQTLSYQETTLCREDYMRFRGENSHHLFVESEAKENSLKTMKNFFVFHYEDNKRIAQVYSHGIKIYTIDQINGKFDYKNSWLIEELPSA